MTRGAPLLLLLAVGCVPKGTPDAAGPKELPTVTVTVAPLQVVPVQRAVNVVGSLGGYEEATVSPKVDGRVLAVRADIGDVVYPGQVLLELDPTDLQLAVAEMSRGLDAELARLGLDRPPAGPFDVEAVPSVRRADVALANARTKFTRVKGVAERSAVTSDEFDASKAELDAADAAKRDAVTQAQATLATARLKQAQLAIAEQRLADATLKAPAPPGWDAWAAVVTPGAAPLRYAVGARLVSEGEMIRSMPAVDAFKLVVTYALKLRAAVPERYVPEVKVGQVVEVKVEACPGCTFAGRVTRVNPTIDRDNRTFAAEIVVANLDGRLKPGGFARAAIQTKTDPAVKTVPPAAVVTFAGVTKVFVAESGKAKAVLVTLGTTDKDWVEVAGDLPAGATVVTSGHSQLVDGSPIKVRE